MTDAVKKSEVIEPAKADFEPAKAIRFPPRAKPGVKPDWDARLTSVMARTTKARAKLAE